MCGGPTAIRYAARTKHTLSQKQYVSDGSIVPERQDVKPAIVALKHKPLIFYQTLRFLR